MARQQARLGSGRLNAFRLGDYYPSTWIYINSLLISRPGAAQGIVVDKSLTMGEAIGDVPFTASFKVRYTTSPPQQGQSIYISLGSTDHRIFGGEVVACSQTQKRYNDKPEYVVRCESNHRLLNRRLVTARFTSMDAGDIVKALVNSYSTGFTAVHVNSMGTIDEIEFTNERMTKAITRAVERVGARWYMDPRNDIHAYAGEESGISPAAAISVTGKHWDHQHERDTSQVRTKVFVYGGGHATTGYNIPGTTLIGLTGSDYLSGATTITLGRYFYDVASVSPNFLGATSWFLVLSNSLSVGGLKELISKGETATVVGVAQSTTYQNSLAAIEGGDGIHEYSMTDGRLTQAGALQRAQAEIGVYGAIEQKGTYVTRDPSAVVGRALTLNVASPTHITSISARIQRVSVSKFEESTRSWSATDTQLFPQRAVTYSSAAVRDIAQILGDFERGGS